MATEETKPTQTEADEAQTEEAVASQTEKEPEDNQGISGDTGGGTMPWGDNPGG